jgi:glycosyltransferase involved in cell wall biosynthesis
MGLPGKKTILTIHDFYSARRGGWLNRLIIRIFWFYLPAWKVKIVTVISEWSREEILKIIPFAKKKIRVIPNPVMIPSGPFTYAFNSEKTNILMVGTKPNKNLEGMLAACSELNCSLTILGKLTEEQVRLLDDYQMDYSNRFNVSYEEVIQLYKDCDLLFFASFEEGFGLPILEAQAVGRPVITSNRAAMPDTAGEGACLVDPYDVDSMKEGLRKVIGDEKYREKLIKKGLENLKRFEPERIAGMYMELYREVAGGK